MTSTEPALPGEASIARGLSDLATGVESAEALLVAIGAPRLRRLGVPVPDASALPSHPEARLYRLLDAREGAGAHSRYNALIRQLVSYERAVELLQESERRRRA